jgi:biotin carboxyl carrier protein
MGALSVASRAIVLRDARGEHRVSIGENGTVSVDGVHTVEVHVDGAGELRVGIGGALQPAWSIASGQTRWVFVEGRVFEFEVHTEGTRRRAGTAAGSLSAPMPATVVRIDAVTGDAVRRGDTLIILEAMKMELPVRAPADGTVAAVLCKPGDLVQPGVPLIEITSGS